MDLHEAIARAVEDGVRRALAAHSCACASGAFATRAAGSTANIGRGTSGGTVDTRVPPRVALTVADVAERLQTDVQAVRRLIRAGKIDAKMVGKGYRVRPAALDEFLGD